MSTLDYDYKFDVIIDKIKSIDAQNVILQFPEGLKSDAIHVSNTIQESLPEVNVIIDADPCFGACDLADVKVNKHIDLVVHFAHTPLPIKTDCPVLFIEAHSSADVEAPILDALDNLDPEVNTVGLVTTTQHIHKLDVDVIIYVGSGDFHALGVKLFTQKPVILADPFIGKSRNIEEFYDRILRVRFARITKASSAKSFGIIMSSKKGQLRFDLAIHLKKLIKDHGFDAQILNMDYVSPDLLLPYDLDAFVMTACPRIAIDDSAMYKKPVLTPDELEIVLGLREWDDYQMDEIIIHDEQT